MKKDTLNITGEIIENGIRIKVGGKKFDVIYPSEIWKGTPEKIKIILRDNITFADTHLLGLIFKKEKLQYNTNFPFLESFFFRNQLNDMLICEKADKVKNFTYLKSFYNSEFEFKGGDSTIPNSKFIPNFNNSDTAVIPFTFGKESLTTFALCLELGIKPVLVYSQEPTQPYEEKYKKKKLKEISKKYKIPVYFLKNDPGLFRADQAFKLKPGTELGWGTQTTVLALKMLPFVLKHQANYIFLGSEYSNNEYENINGWKAYLSADQTSFWTHQQNNIIRLLTNDQCQLKASLEPLEESFIFFILHHRYPDLGKYQFSCSGKYPLLENSQWCHKCYKCERMYLFAKAFGIDPKKIGFKKDILKDKKLFNHYFGDEFQTGSSNELDFSFYCLYKSGDKSYYNNLFIKNKLPFLKKWSEFVKEFSSIKTYENLPQKYKIKMLNIFEQEMEEFKCLYS